jgi:hypothetical protein
MLMLSSNLTFTTSLPGIEIVNKILNFFMILRFNFRCIDICLDNEIERIHAVRLIRRVAHVVPKNFPSVLLPPLIAIVMDGSSDKDKMIGICLATLCELCKKKYLSTVTEKLMAKK